MKDLVDYLRDKLEHADDPTPFRLNGLLLNGCTCPDIDISTAGDPPELRRTVKGLDSRCPIHERDRSWRAHWASYGARPELDVEATQEIDLRDYWLLDHLGGQPLAIPKKRWWRRG